MKTQVDLMFDGLLKTCKISRDRNGELLCEAEDGQFVKFPGKGDFDAMVEAYNKENDKPVEAIADVVYGEVTTFTEDK